jgi:hypothetical protein
MTFLGVLQILEIQNSPHQHSESLYGQYIFPQACPPLTSIRQPFDSAYLRAVSISDLGCFFRGIKIVYGNQENSCLIRPVGQKQPWAVERPVGSGIFIIS